MSGTPFVYQGTWTPSSSAPVPSTSPTAGDVYRVFASGTTSGIPGITEWYEGDQAVYLDGAWRKLDGINRDVPSILDWGADPTGVADSTSQIQAAIDFVVGAGGGDLLFPVGKYRHSGLTINSAGEDNKGYIRLIALGNRSLTSPNNGVSLTCTSATNNHLCINNCQSVEIDGISFFPATGTTSTAGWAINVGGGQNLTLRNIVIRSLWNGILIDGSNNPIIENCDIERMSGEYGILLQATLFDITSGRVDRLYINPSPTSNPQTLVPGFTGLLIADGVSSINWIKTGISYAGNGLVLGTFAGCAQRTPSFHQFYDFAVENCATGLYLSNCSDCSFNNVYVALSDNDGVYIADTMDQSDSDKNPYGGPVYFNLPLINANKHNGMVLAGSPSTFIVGGVIGSNSANHPELNYDGILVSSPTACFSIIGTRVGGDATNQLGTIGDQRYGINILPTVTAPSFVIDKINGLGNYVGALFDASTTVNNNAVGSIVGVDKFASTLPSALVNGAFQIWQRGTSFSFGSATPCADFWVCMRHNSVSGGILSQQGPGPLGSQYYARLQRQSGDPSTEPLEVIQVLTTMDSLPFVGAQVCLAFFARPGANFSGAVLRSEITLGAGDDQTATQLVGGGWTKQTGYSKDNILSTAMSDWLLFTQSLSVPAIVGVPPQSTSQIAIRFYYTPTTVSAGTNDYVDIGLVSLQTGYGPPLLEIRPYWLDLQAAQYRFRKSFPAATTPADGAGTAGAAYVRVPSGLSSSTRFGVEIPLIPPMRAAPFVTSYNPSSANNEWYDTTHGADRIAVVSGIADSTFRVDGTNGVAGSANYIHWTADAELT